MYVCDIHTVTFNACAVYPRPPLDALGDNLIIYLLS